MRNLYSLLLCFGLFVTSNIVAQSCPPTGFSNGTSLYFFYDSGTSACVDRPTTVTAESSEFTLVDCGDVYSVYNLTTGAPLVNPNFFTADFGYATCEYTNGTLTNETLSLEQIEAIFNTLSIYPNPVTKGDVLTIKFASNINASVNLYNLTGKLILSNELENSRVKPLGLSNLPNGVYLLQITFDNLSITRKVVIMK